MGLLDQFPTLDDETFEEMVKEIRSLIPQYARESWTDYNVSDPGITFLELFAWLAEMQIYRLNRVTDKNYEQFLKLVGLSPYGAQPAKVDVTFDEVESDITIKKGTEIATDLGGTKIFFEIEEDVNLVQSYITQPDLTKKPNLFKIITSSNSKVINNKKANEKENIYFAAFGEKGGIGATLELGFCKLPLKKEIQITFYLFEKDLPSPGINGHEPSSSVELIWEYLSEGKWKELTIKKDTTLALNRSGRIIFDVPSDIGQKDGLYWIRCRWMKGQYEIAPLVSRVILNTVSAIQTKRETKEERIKEDENSDPGYVMKLESKNVINKIILDIDDIQDWCGLLKQIKYQADSASPSPGNKLLSKFDVETQGLIDEWEGEQEPDNAMKYAIVESLNKVIECRDLYDEDSFSDKDIDTAQVPKKALNKKKENVPIAEMRTLNRFLIEAAYPCKIKKNRLIVQVCKENQKELWYGVDDFESSGPDDNHYVFEPTTGELTFGNGLNGRIPESSQTIEACYKTTLGQKGNVIEEQEWAIYETIPACCKITLGQKGNVLEEQKGVINETGLENLIVKNYKQATGGSDAETIEHAKSRAKKDFRTPYRAITSEDYEKLALSTPGLRVARAKAIPDFNPNYPCIDIPGSITIVIVPYTRGGEINPTPRKGFIQTVSSFLNSRRLITTDLHVIGPEYVKISVMCKVHVTEKSNPYEVVKRVKDALNKFLDPLKGGQDGKGWPFGRAVYSSEIYQKIDDIEGVEHASGVSMSAENLDAQSINGLYKKEKNVIIISPIALVVSGEHTVDII